MTLKAYSVLENDEFTGSIYFAKHRITAAKAGANEFADGELGAVTCRREKWADQYAEAGTIPASVMVGAGWHFECFGCGMRLDEDKLRDNNLTPDGVIGHLNGRIFCCEECKTKDAERRARDKIIGNEFLAMLRQRVERRLGSVEFVSDDGQEHVYVSKGVVKQAFVSFKFPGMKYNTACLRLDDEYKIGPVRPHFTCSTGDREAFEAFADALNRAKPKGEA